MGHRIRNNLTVNTIRVLQKGRVRAVTGTADTFLASDRDGVVTRTNANASTATVPQNLFKPGDELNIVNLGAGDVTIGGSGITFVSAAGLILEQNGWARLRFLSASTVVVMGSGLAAT